MSTVIKLSFGHVLCVCNDTVLIIFILQFCVNKNVNCNPVIKIILLMKFYAFSNVKILELKHLFSNAGFGKKKFVFNR